MNIKSVVSQELNRFKLVIVQFQRDWTSLFEA